MPPPANWQDFQTLIAEVARFKFNPDSVQEFGRLGQKQSGVDVYATDHFKKRIGIQCKETKKQGLKTTQIDEEIVAALTFTPRLDLLIVATTARRDAVIQRHINQLNASATYPFEIQVWFWDDINRDINRSQSVMSSCYRTFLERFGADELKSHLSGLRLGFDRAAFRDDFLHERNYDDFEDALVDTKALLKTGFLYDRRTRSVILQIAPSSMVGDAAYQRFLERVENSLEKIYQEYLRDKATLATNPRQLDERAGDYNISRRKLIVTINSKLRAAGLSPINVSY